MKRFLLVIAILLIAGLSSQAWGAEAACSGAICYVDTASTGSGDGTTIATTGDHAAFKTIAEVNALTYAADTQILFKKGCTWREQLTVPSSGTSGHPITFGAYGTGEKPIISGDNLVTPGTSWAVCASYQTAKSYSFGNDVTVAGKMNTRNILPADTSSYDGTKVRLTLTAHSTESTQIDGVSIGEATALSAFDAAPTRITFDSGSSSVTISAGETKVSDEITFTFDKTKRYLIHTYNAGAAYRRYDNTTGDGAYLDWTTASDQTVSSGALGTVNQTVADKAYSVSKIEVLSGVTNTWQTAATTEPKIVFFNGTKGTLEASVAALTAAREWFWEGNVLYIYAASDPDTLYTSPGIEIGQRDNAYTISGKNYVTLDGFTLKNTNSHVVSISGNITGTSVKNSDISYSTTATAGIIYWATAGGGLHNISGNTIHDTGGDGLTMFDIYTDSGTESYIQNNEIYNTAKFGIYHKANYYIIQNNTVHDTGTVGTANWGIGVQCEASDSGTGENNLVRYNKIYNTKGDNTDACGLMLDHWTTANDVYYNLSYNNQGTGMTVYNALSGNIYNNVFYGNHTSGTDTYLGELALLSTDNLLDNIVVKNNIGYSTGTGTFGIIVNAEAAGKTLTITNNDWYRASGNWYSWAGTPGATLSTWNALTGVGTDLNSDPLFVSAATGDFILKVNSPCKNAGTDVSLVLDYEGRLVPKGPAPDIGAYEWPSLGQGVGGNLNLLWIGK